MDTYIKQINQSALKFLSNHSLKETYSTIIEEALRLVQADYGTIFLLENDELKNVFSSPGFEDLIVRKRGFTYEAFVKNTPMVLQGTKVLQIHPIVQKMKVRSILFIPLSYQDKSIGVLTIRSVVNKRFSHDELEILKLFGSLACLAIRNAHADIQTKEAQETIDRSLEVESTLESIYKSSLKFLARSSPGDVYKTIIKEATKLTDVDSGAIYLYDDGDLKPVYASKSEMYKITPRKDGNNYKAFTTQKIIVAKIADLETAHPVLRKLKIRSSIFVPLSYQKKAIGVLVLDSNNREHFVQKKLRILALLGSMASLAIRKTQLYAETKKSLEVRDLFIAMAAHELRTPLTTINGYIQLLHSKLGNETTIQGKWMNQLLYESQRLTYLINELLELNRIKAGQFQYNWKECDLRTIIARALSSVSFSHPGRKIVFNDSVPNQSAMVIGDFDKLLQVLINFLDNAAKFSKPPSEILLGIKISASFITISIQDFGKGIAKKDLPYLFNEFYKGSRNETEEGIGLGLFLAKSIINQHHGDISVYSEETKGTRFEVKLPRLKSK